MKTDHVIAIALSWVWVMGTTAGVAPAFAASVQKPGPLPGSLPIPNVFLAWPQGSNGGAVAFDSTTGRQKFTLPKGKASADGARYFATEPLNSPIAMTKISDFALSGMLGAPGGLNGLHTVRGSWDLSAVSPNGQAIVLTRVPSEAEKQAWAKTGKWQTEIQVLDLTTYQTRHTLKLDGNFEVEAISADGTSLFLVEHLPAAKPDRYVIRWYDLSREQLVADPLRSKTADEVMTGYAWGGTASTDGEWLFTLYLSTDRKVAFIHMLNLNEKFTVCVDLPSGQGDFEALKGYALAYSPQRQTVYGVNPRLGIVAEVKLGDYKLNGNKFVANKVVTFKPDASLKSGADMPPVHNAISSDGEWLYFAQGNTAYSYNVSRGNVVPLVRGDAPVIGIAPIEEGRRALLARLNQPPIVVDGASGRIVPAQDLKASRDNCPITKPAGFIPPNRKPDLSPGEFWYGTNKLWTGIYRGGIWGPSPFPADGYGEKVFWWSEDFDLPNELQPNLVVSGRRLDAPAPPLIASRATNAFAGDIGDAMLVGVDFPTAGCWEITGRYRGTELSFVVWLEP